MNLEGKSGKTISIGCRFPPKFANSGTLAEVDGLWDEDVGSYRGWFGTWTTELSESHHTYRNWRRPWQNVDV